MRGSGATGPDPVRHRLLGLPVDAVDRASAEEHAARAVALGLPLRFVVTNHNKCYLAVRDPELRGFLEEADLVLAESSVVWGCRVLGLEGVGPAWGVVLMEGLLDRAHKDGWSVFLLGARPEVVSRLAERLEEERPGARIVGVRDGYFGPEDEPTVRAAVLKADPDLLLVAMGSPRQERFIRSLGRDPAVRVALGVGGGFDVHSGAVRDAPSWIRGSGLEWLWRSAMNPRLLRRYAVVNPWFVGWVLVERFLGRTPSLRGKVDGGSG
jgi:N-acetylglucosaminyldiphosphoundecaprenol N-acetyl-beta-D-mannosaminyltransferase